MNLSILLFVAVSLSYVSSGIINVKRVKSAEGLFNKAVAALPNDSKHIIYCLIMLLYECILAVVLIKVYDQNLCQFAKIIAITSLMWPMALIDYRYKRIPNKLVLLAVIYRIIVFVFELIFYRDSILTTILSEIIAAVGIFVILTVSNAIIKNGVGMGDIKLFMVMGLLLGLYQFMSTLFVIMIIALIVSLYILIVKKKSKDYEFAFGPIIGLGTVIASIIFGN